MLDRDNIAEDDGSNNVLDVKVVVDGISGVDRIEVDRSDCEATFVEVNGNDGRVVGVKVGTITCQTVSEIKYSCLKCYLQDKTQGSKLQPKDSAEQRMAGDQSQMFDSPRPRLLDR